MKIEHLEERVKDYCQSIEKVVEKKILWKTSAKAILLETLERITNDYKIGWKVQELDWLNSNEAINITFETFPPELIKKTNMVNSYQFIKGCALVFSQSYNGEIHIFILFPITDNIKLEESTIQLGIYDPQEISEKLIVEKVDEFLKEMINWEIPMEKKQMGFITE